MKLSLSLGALAAASLVNAGPTTKMVSRENGYAKPDGVVSANGTQFSLDGKPFFFAGTNSYWITQLENDADARATMKAVADAGLKVLRIWGFGTWTAVPADPKVAYYQILQNGTQTFNWAENGIPRLDRTVALAEEFGIKLVWPLMNNWNDYGGINTTYVSSFVTDNSTTKYHDMFYSEPTIVGWYQEWVKFVVNRYKHSPAIFSWQLGNEPRCKGNLQNSGNCTVATLQNWIKDQSSFIKQLDPYHMVSIGSEGFFNWGSNETVIDFLYNGADGVDFDEDLKIDTIDYGTYHMYPGHWTKDPDTAGWTQRWVRDHVFAQNVAQKPTVLEEFGVGSEANATKWFPGIYKTALDGQTAGIMHWQFGICGLSVRGKPGDLFDDQGCSHNDSFTSYPGNATYDLLLDVAKQQNAKSG